mmetsp:Transcript_8155/g.9044  ORF Transcript_8155/g.9044 Transcript_8155/m.9044 type:complete len:369 (-) Transcript_8155:52-1158(-)
MNKIKHKKPFAFTREENKRSDEDQEGVKGTPSSDSSGVVSDNHSNPQRANDKKSNQSLIDEESNILPPPPFHEVDAQEDLPSKQTNHTPTLATKRTCRCIVFDLLEDPKVTCIDWVTDHIFQINHEAEFINTMKKRWKANASVVSIATVLANYGIRRKTQQDVFDSYNTPFLQGADPRAIEDMRVTYSYAKKQSSKSTKRKPRSQRRNQKKTVGKRRKRKRLVQKTKEKEESRDSQESSSESDSDDEIVPKRKKLRNYCPRVAPEARKRICVSEMPPMEYYKVMLRVKKSKYQIQLYRGMSFVFLELKITGKIGHCDIKKLEYFSNVAGDWVNLAFKEDIDVLLDQIDEGLPTSIKVTTDVKVKYNFL